MSEIDEHIASAIDSLTAAARYTYTESSGESRRGDFGEIACRVITAVAANLGSVEDLLAGRPGSWEADYIRQMVNSTAPEDLLIEHRTEPVRLHLDAEDALYELGIGQLYEDDLAAVDAEFGTVMDAAIVAHGTDPVVAKAAPLDGKPIEDWTADDFEAALASRARLLTLDADLARLAAEFSALNDMRDREYSEYTAAWLQAANDAARAKRMTAPVVLDDPITIGSSYDELNDHLEREASAATPLPGSGLRPGDYSDSDTLAQTIMTTERAAGRSPRDRLRAN